MPNSFLGEVQKLKINDKKTILKHLLVVLAICVLFFVLLFVLQLAGYVCPFKKYIGIRCFGCGMRNAFWALLHLDFKGAFISNPLIYPLALAVGAGFIYYILFYGKTKNSF